MTPNAPVWTPKPPEPPEEEGLGGFGRWRLEAGPAEGSKGGRGSVEGPGREEEGRAAGQEGRGRVVRVGEGRRRKGWEEGRAAGLEEEG